MKRLIKIFSFMTLIAMLFVACTSTEKVPKPHTGPFVYYLNSSYTALVAEPYTGDLKVMELMGALASSPGGDPYIAPIADLSIINTTQAGDKFIIDFGREYLTLNGISEILVRAAIVKTITQDEEVSYVEFTVAGDPLTLSNGDVIGIMDGNKFVDYFGKEQDSLMNENLTIYFASSDGTSLVKETHRVYFDNSLSLEQAVIKSMKDAPESSDAKTAISQNTNIINITTTDGTCYLDLDMSFYDTNSDVTQQVALYAITNSLCELDSVRRVLVTIIDPNEDNNPESIATTLSGVYEKNTDIIQ